MQKHSQHFKLLFFTTNLHFFQTPTYRKPNLPLTSSIYLVFLPLEMQGKLKQTKVYHMFVLLVLKETNDKSSKSGSSKNPFLQCTCYWYNLLRWMFFILCENWKALLFMIVYRYSEILLTVMSLLSLKPLFWRKSVFHPLSP